MRTNTKMVPYLPHDPKFKRALDWIRLGGLKHLDGKSFDPFTLKPVKGSK